MVNLHTCKTCGETIYYQPISGNGRKFLKRDVDTKKLHLCGGWEEYENYPSKRSKKL